MRNMFFVVAMAEIDCSLLACYQDKYRKEIAGFSLARTREFLAGRILAEYALRQFGLTEIYISRNAFGGPIWPEKVTGSISHDKGRYAVLLAAADNVDAVGVDIQSLIPISAAEKILPILIRSQGDGALELTATPSIRHDTLVTVCVAAKECALKACSNALQQALGMWQFSIMAIRKMGANGQTWHVDLMLHTAEYAIPLSVMVIYKNNYFVSFCFLKSGYNSVFIE